MKSETLELLKKYYKNTDKKTIIKESAEVETLAFDAPNAFEYIRFLRNYYSFKRGECLEKSITVPENMAPNFEGHFFCIKSHNEERNKRHCICL